MRSISLLLLSTTMLTAFVSLPAGAVDLPRTSKKAKPAVTSQQALWSGVYGGGHIGAAVLSKANLTGGEGAFFTAPTDGSKSFDISGALLGAHLGLDVRQDNLVFGVVGDLDTSTFAGSTTGGSELGYSSTLAVKHDWFTSLRGRVGYAMDNVLLFGTGGWALSGETASGTISYIGSPLANYQVSKTVSGWVAGGGIDYAVNDRWTIGAEFLHYDFGKVDMTSALPNGSNNGGVPIETSSAINVIRLDVSYKF